jgi:hypothetical protein
MCHSSFLIHEWNKLHDHSLKRMIDGGMCGSLIWVPGIVIRAHCWDCLKGQQKHNAPAPDPNLRE